jgi:hypothetical protein
MGLQTEGDKLTAAQKGLFSPGGSAPETFSTSELNLFRYCGDDPVDGSDPLGLTIWSNLKLLRDFIFGTGQTQRAYDRNSVEAREMASSPRVNQAREAFSKNGHKDVNYGYGSGKAFDQTVVKAAIPVGTTKIPFLGRIPIPVNPLASDRLGSTAAQVGGFAGASIVNNGDGTATFSVHNEAGARSFFYHAIGNREGTTGPFRTIIQDFKWTEPIR